MSGSGQVRYGGRAGQFGLQGLQGAKALAWPDVGHASAAGGLIWWASHVRARLVA